MAFTLRASIPEWVKAGAKFCLGCCFSNYGSECFGEWTTCSCLDEAIAYTTPGTNRCPDGTVIYHLLSGYFMDRFAYAGLGWGPDGADHLGSNSIYCRKFTPIHPCSIVVATLPSGGVYSAGARMPTLNRTGRGGGCAIDMFIFLAGVAKRSQLWRRSKLERGQSLHPAR